MIKYLSWRISVNWRDNFLRVKTFVNFILDTLSGMNDFKSFMCQTFAKRAKICKSFYQKVSPVKVSAICQQSVNKVSAYGISNLLIDAYI